MIKATKIPAQKIGKVTAAATTRFVIECDSPGLAPPIGSLVATPAGIVTVVALVTAIEANGHKVRLTVRPIAYVPQDEEARRVFVSGSPVIPTGGTNAVTPSRKAIEAITDSTYLYRAIEEEWFTWDLVILHLSYLLAFERYKTAAELVHLSLDGENRKAIPLAFTADMVALFADGEPLIDHLLEHMPMKTIAKLANLFAVVGAVPGARELAGYLDEWFGAAVKDGRTK